MDFCLCSICSELIDFDDAIICVVCRKKYCDNCFNLSHKYCRNCNSKILRDKFDKN